MDVFYEESAVAKNTGKQARRWKILNILSYVALCLMIILAYNMIMFIPIGTPEQKGYMEALSLFLFFTMNFLLMAGFWVFLFTWKRRTNVAYDYVFVSGELRITKVFHNHKRKLLTRFESENIMQIGDADSNSYDRLCKDPNVKQVICTSNDIAADGKFFMYILINDDGKKLYVLECRETMLMHIMRFAKRSALATDYVMQDKKV